MRTDAAVPTEVLSAAFGMPKPDAARRSARSSRWRTAVTPSSAHGRAARRAGNVTQSERDQRQRQLADQAARAELTGYAGNVRE